MSARATLAFILLTAGISLLGADVQAQEALTTLAAGDRIRFEIAPGTTISGKVIRVEGDSLAFATPGATEVQLPLAQLQALQVARRSPIGAFDGALAGLAGGILVGGFLAAALLSGGDEGASGPALFVLGGAAMALPGTIVGAIVGRGGSVTRWVDVSLRSQPAE